MTIWLIFYVAVLYLQAFGYLARAIRTARRPDNYYEGKSVEWWFSRITLGLVSLAAQSVVFIYSLSYVIRNWPS